jgi:hypothetical protein
MADSKISVIPVNAILTHGRDHCEYMALHRVKVDTGHFVIFRVLIGISKLYHSNHAKIEVFSKQNDQWNTIHVLPAQYIPIRFEDVPTPQEAWELFKDDHEVTEPMGTYLTDPAGRKLFDEYYPEFARNTNENFDAIIEQLLNVAEILYL